MLAALRLGLAFMPLDPAWPPPRLQQLCDAARPAAIVWSSTSCPGGHGQPAVSEWPLVELPPLAALAAQATEADVAQPPPQQKEQQQGAKAAADSSCCYLMFTSGYTGRPLGVLGTPHGVLNRCRWLERAWPFQVRGGGLPVACVRMITCSVPTVPPRIPCRREIGWHSRPPQHL